MRRRLAVLSLATMLACSGDGPLAPKYRGTLAGPVQPRATIDSTAQAGIPVPPNNTQPSNVDWFDSGLVVPANTWLHLVVQGGIAIQADPMYLQDWCSWNGCPAPYAGQTWGPGGGDYAQLLVGVQLRQGNQSTAVTMHDYSLEPYARDAFLRVTQEAHVWLSRTGISGGASCTFNRPPGYTDPSPCPTGADQVQQGAYVLSGTQTARLEAASLSVDATPLALSAGDTAHFAARMPGTAYRYTWAFLTGDTVGLPRTTMPYVAAPCGIATATCNWVPPASGRMYLTADISGGPSLFGASKVVWVGAPSDDLLLTADSTVVSPGGTVTFAASTQNHSALEVTGWTWTPDTGTARPTSCSAGTNPCRVAVQESGTIRVSANVHGVSRTASAYVRAIQRLLSLICAPSTLIRGDTVACTATAANAGDSMAVTGWRFAGDSGFTASQTSSLSHRWIGPVAAGGRVTVTAVVGGRTDSATADFAVQPRATTAADTLEYTLAEEQATDLPLHPDSLHDLGHEHTSYGIANTSKIRLITSGPNQLIAYLVGIPFSGAFVVHVNRDALSVGSGFYNAQLESAPAYGNACTKGQVVPFIDVILTHEGIPPGPNSHIGLYLASFNATAWSRVESVMSNTSFDDVMAKASSRLSGTFSSAEDASKKADEPSNAPVWCTFNYAH